MNEEMKRPASDEYSTSFENYVSKVGEGSIIGILERQQRERNELLRSVAPGHEQYRYAEGKWSVREVVGHMCDAERTFAYRAMCFARGEKTPLPAFDEDEYMRASNFNDVPLRDLAEELSHVRRATIALLRNLSPEMWTRKGVANASPASVRAIAFIIAGHEAHHLAVLGERYLQAPDSLVQRERQIVNGIGGIFFKANDAEALRAWYQTHLALPLEDWGGAVFKWRDADSPDQAGYTVWSPFAGDTDYFAPSTARFMINYRVNDLQATLARLRAAGVSVDAKVEESDFGKFGWAFDPEGNKIELWEAPG